MVDLENLQSALESLHHKSKKLEEQLDEFTQRHTTPGTDDSPFATIPLIDAEAMRGRLELACRRWRLAAIGFGLAFLITGGICCAFLL